MTILEDTRESTDAQVWTSPEPRAAHNPLAIKDGLVKPSRSTVEALRAKIPETTRPAFAKDQDQCAHPFRSPANICVACGHQR